jgi:hypothetical protein
VLTPHPNNNNNNNNNNNYGILYKMTEENVPGSKYVNVPANNISNKNNNNNNSSTEGKIILIQKVNKQTKMRSGNKNVITKNYVHRTIGV